MTPGRREKHVTVTEKFVAEGVENRDFGKSFRLVEMPCEQACEWFDRAAQLIGRGGGSLPPTWFDHGPAGFVVLGIGAVVEALGRAPAFEVKPLKEELLACIVSMRSPGAAADLTVPAMIRGQIEEVQTYYFLLEEVLSLHLGFSLRERLSTFREVAGAMMVSMGLNTPTSDANSASSSAAGSPPVMN